MNLDCLRTTPAEVVARLAEVLGKQEFYEKVMARLRQRQIAAELGQNRRAIEGLGRPRLEVDTYAYHYWGQRLGYQCWKDPQFLREFERDNTECRVRCGGTKEIQVGYGSGSPAIKAPVSPVESNRRWRKSYG